MSLGLSGNSQIHIVLDLSAPAGSGTGGPLVQSSGEPAVDDICTIASIERRATIEVQVAHAEDFCELLSQALAISVFRTPLSVTPGVLWHYAGSDPSCQLRFGSTRNRMVVRNSVRTCRWFARHWSGWRVEAGAGVSVDDGPTGLDGHGLGQRRPHTHGSLLCRVLARGLLSSCPPRGVSATRCPTTRS